MTIYDQARAFQQAVEQNDQVSLARMAQELARILPRLVADAEAAAATVAQMHATDGNWRTYAAIRSREIARQVESEVRSIMSRLRPELLNGQLQAIEQGLMAAEVLTASALPEGLRLGMPGLEWSRVPFGAVAAQLGMTEGSTPLGRLLDRLGYEAGQKARAVLLSGLVSGRSPRAVGRDLSVVADITRARAETIARTETLRAYREAQRQAWAANTRIVPRWRRLAAKSARTCVMCLALDGEEQDSDTIIATHPNDRCTAVPVPITYRDLGLDVDEPPRPERESGAAWFARQSADVQGRILGPGGLAKYQQGASLRDFTRVRNDVEWGPTLERKRLSEVG